VKPQATTCDEIMEYFTDGITTSEWQKRCDTEAGIAKRTFLRRLKDAERSGAIIKTEKGWESNEPPSTTYA
jgi:hypothetical protein